MGEGEIIGDFELERDSKNWIRKAAFGCLFGIMMILGMSAPVYAEPVGETQEAMEAEDAVQDETEDDVNVEESQETETTTNTEINNASSISGKGCQDSLGALGWLVCPTTGKLAEAVDWLYERIEGVLVINPVEMKDGAPIFEIWKVPTGDGVFADYRSWNYELWTEEDATKADCGGDFGELVVYHLFASGGCIEHCGRGA